MGRRGTFTLQLASSHHDISSSFPKIDLPDLIIDDRILSLPNQHHMTLYQNRPPIHILKGRPPPSPPPVEWLNQLIYNS